MKLTTSTIGEISKQIRTGKTPPTKNPEYFDGGIPWFTPGDFSGSLFLRVSKRTISDYSVQAKKATIYEKNTVLITCIGEIGKTGLLDEKGSCNQQITGLSFKDYIYPKFFVYWCRANKNLLEKHTNDAVVPILNNAALSKIKIKYPTSIDDQIRIAHLLNKVETLIAHRKLLIQQLDDFLESVFLKMFGDPVRNEKEWNKVPFSEILTEIGSGKSPKCEARPATDEEWGVLKLSAITSCFYNQNENKALPSNINPDTRHEVNNGDLLFSRKNTAHLVAACAYVFETRPKLLLPDLIFRFRFREDSEVNPLFMWKLLVSETQRKKIQSFAGGAAGSMPNISKANLKKIHLIKPPKAVQDEFAAVVDRVESIKMQYQLSLTELENLYGVLSQKAFKGELDLSQVNLPVSDVQNSNKNISPKFDRITTEEILAKAAKITSPLDSIKQRIKGLYLGGANPAFQAAQRASQLTSQHSKLGETFRQLAAFRRNIPTMDVDQITSWSKQSSAIASITQSTKAILESRQAFQKFTEQDWLELGIRWAFNNYLSEMDDEPFSMAKCSTFIEDQLHDENAEEPFKLSREHYEGIKILLFCSLDSAEMTQRYNDQENKVDVFKSKGTEA